MSREVEAHDAREAPGTEEHLARLADDDTPRARERRRGVGAPAVERVEQTRRRRLRRHAAEHRRFGHEGKAKLLGKEARAPAAGQHERTTAQRADDPAQAACPFASRGGEAGACRDPALAVAHVPAPVPTRRPEHRAGGGERHAVSPAAREQHVAHARRLAAPGIEPAVLLGPGEPPSAEEVQHARERVVRFAHHVRRELGVVVVFGGKAGVAEVAPAVAGGEDGAPARNVALEDNDAARSCLLRRNGAGESGRAAADDADVGAGRHVGARRHLEQMRALLRARGRPRTTRLRLARARAAAAHASGPRWWRGLPSASCRRCRPAPPSPSARPRPPS